MKHRILVADTAGAAESASVGKQMSVRKCSALEGNVAHATDGPRAPRERREKKCVATSAIMRSRKRRSDVVASRHAKSSRRNPYSVHRKRISNSIKLQ